MNSTFKLKWIALLVCGVLCASFLGSCGDDDDDTGGDSKISGKYYLKDYGSSRSVMTSPNLNYCDWGEYMRFSGNTMTWNSRLLGKNTTYRIAYSGNTIAAVNTSDASDVYAFEILENNGSVLVLYSVGEGLYRYLKK